MSDRVSQMILLCEDAVQERLVKAFMRVCRLPTESPTVKSLVASRLCHGGNVTWVLNRFPMELHACRQRHIRARTLLIVVIDADDHSVEGRRRDLLGRLTEGGYDGFRENEPAALLIPKRHIETWVCALLALPVTEDEDCKRRKKSSKEDIRQVAQTLFDWSRPNAAPGSSCVQSLSMALPEWRKIS